MNPTILSVAMGKIVGQTGLFGFGMATGLEEKTLNWNLLKSTKIDLVLHPDCVEGLVNIYF